MQIALRADSDCVQTIFYKNIVFKNIKAGNHGNLRMI